MKQLISIISAVHNEELHLREMIESVQYQYYTNWELLIVDDLSTDETLNTAKQAAASDPRVRVLRNPGTGKVSAFNFGFQHSLGDFVILLGGDDRIPSSSLEIRHNSISVSCEDPTSAIAYFRLITFSDSPRHDGIVVPKSATGNRSGGTMIMGRALAEKIFPIPEELVAEDIWLSNAAEVHASNISDGPDIVLEYRIHPGNSNPRNKPFEEMSDAMHLRAQPYDLLLSNGRFAIPDAMRKRLESRVQLEELRYAGQCLKILTHRTTPLMGRLRALSMASPALFRVRQRFFRALSGWR